MTTDDRWRGSYDAWKLADPDEGCCEHCGAHYWQCADGWQPDQCTGECNRIWRDPDFELELKRERDDDKYPGEGIDDSF